MRVFYPARLLVKEAQGGVGFHFQNLITQLEKLSITPTFGVPIDLFMARFLQRRPMVLYDELSPGRDISYYWEISYRKAFAQIGSSDRVFKLKNTQLIHWTSHDSLPSKLPAVVTIHDVKESYFPQFSKHDENFHRALKQSYKWIDSVITISEKSKQDIAKFLNFPLERIHVTYLGTRNFSQAAAVNFAQERPFILHVGALQPHKNLANLIKAFAQLKKRPHRLILAGQKTPHYEQVLLPLIEKLGLQGDVLVTGYLADGALKTLYLKAALLVFPSYSEGFGLPLVEAFTHGCPVVSSTAGALPEIQGGAGLEVAPEDIDGWSAAIEQLLDDPSLRERLIALGHERKQLFTWENCAQQTLKAYRSILS